MKTKCHKLLLSILICGICICFAGCSGMGEGEYETSGIQSGEAASIYEATEEDIVSESLGEEPDATVFPSSYEAVSETGKVTMNCTLEVPDDFGDQALHKWKVQGRHLVDQERAYAAYVADRESEIAEEYHSLTDDGIKRDNYIFEDGGQVSIDKTFDYSSEDVYSYTAINVRDPDKADLFASDSVSFSDESAGIEQIRLIMDDLGYGSLNLEYGAAAISHETMQLIEENELNSGLLEEHQRKAAWSEEDDAYIIYAWQNCGGLPVFHELMSLSGSYSITSDYLDNAPVQAIWSARGLEMIQVYYLYDFVESEEVLQLKDFGEIADVVMEKYEDILNDATYEVTRAKLYQRVYIDTSQEYDVEPVWYFEVTENGGSKSVTIIDAVDGKEIYLG